MALWLFSNLRSRCKCRRMLRLQNQTARFSCRECPFPASFRPIHRLCLKSLPNLHKDRCFFLRSSQNWPLLAPMPFAHRCIRHTYCKPAPYRAMRRPTFGKSADWPIAPKYPTRLYLQQMLLAFQPQNHRARHIQSSGLNVFRSLTGFCRLNKVQ